jgi:hypothetical protein
MPGRRIAAVAAVVAALALPAGAHGTAPPAPDWPGQQMAPAGAHAPGEDFWAAYVAAQRYWGVGDGTPGWIPAECAGLAAVEAPELRGPDGTAAAGLGSPSLAWGWCGVAVIDEDPGRLGYLELCLTTTHELGHALGHGHVDDPHNVMYGGGSAAFATFDPPCLVPRTEALLATPRAAKSEKWRETLEARLAFQVAWAP